jgi:hypothetical protein
MDSQQKKAINASVISILNDINKISMSTKKIETMAYIDAWQNELKTIQYIINL